MSDDDRLAGLERAVLSLLNEVRALREDQRPRPVLRESAPPPPPLPPVRPAPRPVVPPVLLPPEDSVDIEALVGRYGTLALATLTILLGLGAFLRWAIAHHLLGPVMRVSLGAVLAIVLAMVGWRLRRKAVAFGNALLGLALAAVHVDAWGAGPALRLIPASEALAIAALASVALAAFARFENDEVLFSVGVGGALLAPFVTAIGEPRIIPLLVFGYVVLEIALTAIRDDGWLLPIYVVIAGCGIYVFAGLAAGQPHDPAALAMAPAAFAAAFALTALFIPPKRHRILLAQAALLFLVVALFARWEQHLALPTLVLASVGTITAYATLRFLPAEVDHWNAAAVLLFPMVFMMLAMVALNDRNPAAVAACAWTAAAGALSLIDRKRHIAHTLVAAAAAGVAIFVAFADIHNIRCVVALSAHSIALTLLMRREREKMLMWVAVPGLLAAAGFTLAVFSGQVDYQYPPFATAASVAGLAVSAAWVTFAWLTARAFEADAPHPLVGAVGLIVPFFWIRAELAGAFSHDAATFLLIAYYAAVGVAAVFVGRARAVPLLRHVGLGLAIYASGKAIVQTADLAIGLRVGSDFLAGVFMLAVAYWYRVQRAVVAP